MAEVLALVEHDPNEVPVLYEEREGIAWITLNRPDKLNALNAEVFRHLAEALERLEEGPGGVGILGGAGRAFAAGADIQDYVDITVEEYRAFMLPPELQLITVYSAGISTNAKEPDAARALVRFLATPEAAAVYKAKGLGL